MPTKIKGIYKGFKFISQIFVVKEREMEIGYPTDVKHVAHVGCDGSSHNAPSWMSEFKTAPDFSTTTISSTRDSGSLSFSPTTKSSRDYDWSMGHKPSTIGLNEINHSQGLSDPAHHKQKSKTKAISSSSPKSSSSSSRSSRTLMKPKAMCREFDSISNRV